KVLLAEVEHLPFPAESVEWQPITGPRKSPATVLFPRTRRFQDFVQKGHRRREWSPLYVGDHRLNAVDDFIALGLTVTDRPRNPLQSGNERDHLLMQRISARLGAVIGGPVQNRLELQ